MRLLVREFHQVVEKFQSLQEVAVKKTKAFITQAQILAQEAKLSSPAPKEEEEEPLFNQQQYISINQACTLLNLALDKS